MTALRDTTADAAAEATRAGPLPGEADPPLALTGRNAHLVRDALMRAHARLARLERETKTYGLRTQITAERAALERALGILTKSAGA
ncbi:MAG: hypothetical protein AB7S70_02490 [Hyphomicrobium sp.]|uniref:hypothetical protein n=1 Tax=Hyphomicrobium sp. TaxID=82 RepID=UPI003D0E8037